MGSWRIGINSGGQLQAVGSRAESVDYQTVEKRKHILISSTISNNFTWNC